ncbi:MAG: hypothetical protein BGN88_03840 [Clostridiales bacterium 43-6]|nr:MAG: hypothetical protein BGN88_03840 [Clostridiales bacterium 43-6]
MYAKLDDALWKSGDSIKPFCKTEGSQDEATSSAGFEEGIKQMSEDEGFDCLVLRSFNERNDGAKIQQNWAMRTKSYAHDEQFFHIVNAVPAALVQRTCTIPRPSGDVRRMTEMNLLQKGTIDRLRCLK